jgi:hypothetical protein
MKQQQSPLLASTNSGGNVRHETSLSLQAHDTKLLHELLQSLYIFTYMHHVPMGHPLPMEEALGSKQCQQYHKQESLPQVK